MGLFRTAWVSFSATGVSISRHSIPIGQERVNLFFAVLRVSATPWCKRLFLIFIRREHRMRGKTIVITGGTSGIGQIAAEKLAGMGARLVLVARDKARGESALTRLRERGPGIAHGIHYADLSRIDEMKRVASEIAAAEPKIDVLINNAGALFNSRQTTSDGLEMTFALNHMSYYVMTHFLRGSLVAGAPSRVVNTSSDAHKGNTLDFNDLQSSNGYRGFKVYGRSNL